MSKIQLEVQKTIEIPAPRFKFGQLVQWQRLYSNQSIYIFTGLIESRTWEEDPYAAGNWHYYTTIQQVECNGEPRFVSGGEELPESELTYVS